MSEEERVEKLSSTPFESDVEEEQLELIEGDDSNQLAVVSNEEVKTDEIDETISDSELEDDDEENKMHFVKISLDEIDRETVWEDVEIWGKKCQVIKSRGTLPMISPKQSQEFNDDKSSRIFNTSALPVYSEDFVKLIKLKMHYDKLEQKEYEDRISAYDEELPEPNEKVARIVLGLQDAVHRFRENLYLMIDPPTPSTRKEGRQMRRRVTLFQHHGYRQLVIVIQKHLQGLITYGHYPDTMFSEFIKVKDKAIKANTSDLAIEYGMELLVIAEHMLPLDETVEPVRRIMEGIASPASEQYSGNN